MKKPKIKINAYNKEESGKREGKLGNGEEDQKADKG